MQLFLFRHGIAISRDDPTCPPDPDRYLTEKGRARTALAARGLAAIAPTFDLVITSPYVRAAQTADIAIQELGYSGQLADTESLIWDAPAKLIVGELAELSADNILCVGHAPHLDALTAYLVGSDVMITEMKKAGVVHLDVIKCKRGGANVYAAYPPRVLRRLGEA
jgi:phosphohistidine phosphatase